MSSTEIAERNPAVELVLSRRILARVTKPDGEDGCWLYATRNANGYGRIRTKGRLVILAHRLFYLVLVGPIPDGLTLDHTCHNADLSCPGGPTCRHRRCVNPAHLEPVTATENSRRGRAGVYNAVKTHCRNGHPYAGANLRAGSYGRACRACNNAAAERYRQRRRERAA